MVLLGALSGPLPACGETGRAGSALTVTVAPTDDPDRTVTALVDPGACVFVRPVRQDVGLELAVRPCAASRRTVTVVNQSGWAVVGALGTKPPQVLHLAPNTGGFWVAPD